jgi:hypothetical protein
MDEAGVVKIHPRRQKHPQTATVAAQVKNHLPPPAGGVLLLPGGEIRTQHFNLKNNRISLLQISPPTIKKSASFPIKGECGSRGFPFCIIEVNYASGLWCVSSQKRKKSLLLKKMFHVNLSRQLQL